MVTKLNPASLALSELFACAIPLSIVVYRITYSFDPLLAPALLRPTVVGASFLMCLLLSRGQRVTQSEKAIFAVLTFLCTALFITSAVATNPARALTEWIKLLILCTIPLTLGRALRRVQVARLFGRSLLVAGAISGALIVQVYLKYMGAVLPTYEASRTYKQLAMNADIPLNSVAFECIFSYIAGMCLVRNSRLLSMLGILLLLISSFLTGSRAPSTVFLLSALALAAITGFKSKRPLLRLAAWHLAGLILIGAVGLAMIPTSYEASVFTEGRSQLWSGALHKFVQKPVFGYGYLSAEDDPGYIAGGYHNEFVTALAEQGIVGSIAVFTLFLFAFSCCWKLAGRLMATEANGSWFLFAFLFLFFRSFVEIPGLFGTAQAPPDFLAYIFLAIVISRLSYREDSLKLRMRKDDSAPFRSRIGIPFSVPARESFSSIGSR
jgi:O-antigen ligase